MFARFSTAIAHLTGGIAFYTCLPIPITWNPAFQKVAVLAPWMGLLIGGLLSLLDGVLQWLGMPIVTRSALIVVVGICLTGGLHLDGAIDTADGLAVKDPDRRLTVMAESTTGAFGAMAAVMIVLLKTAALSDLPGDRWLILMGVAGWGRWAQQLAIASYPYLKETGLGAFHKQAIQSWRDTLPALGMLLGWSMIPLLTGLDHWPLATGMAIGGMAIAGLTSSWFNHKLGGHTGDTYGAVVEWTEALLLCGLTFFQPTA